MVSLLGTTQANISVGYHEEKLFLKIIKTAVHFRYADDIFVLFRNEKEFEENLIKLDGMHPSLKFTSEKEKNKYLPLLDVFVEYTKTGYEISV